MTDYRADFHAWSREQADALQRRSANELDWENIAEEIDSLGRQQRSEVRNRLIVLLAHLLKWQLQPQRRGRSWRLTIFEQRDRIEHELDDSPSLEPLQEELFQRAYKSARLTAAKDTRLSLARFPVDPPFTLAQALDPDWLPGPPEAP